MLKIENKLKIYEINGEELELGKEETLKVKSHYKEEFVIIQSGNKEITISVKDLMKAVENATNF